MIYPSSLPTFIEFSILRPNTAIFRSYFTAVATICCKRYILEANVANIKRSFDLLKISSILSLITCSESENPGISAFVLRSEEHTSELQSRFDLVCRLLLEKKKKIT